MHANRVNKRIAQLVGSRDHLISDLPLSGEPIETVTSGTERTHFVLDATATRSILTDDDSFAPAPIAASIQRLSEHTDIDASEAYRFLTHNPLQTDRPAHADVRQQFVCAYARSLQRHGKRLSAGARSHFDRLTQHPPCALTRDVVAPAVDAILQILLADDDVPAEWPARIGGGAAMLEYMHHPRKLAAKSAQIKALFDELAAHRGEPGPRDDVRDAILTSYVLQGREPIIGGITAYLCTWLSAPEAERAQLLESITAVQLFARTAPVNYIGRSARKDVRVAGHAISAGDHVLLMLPWANADVLARQQRSLAFGAGAHMCAGQALALALTDAFLDALRYAHHAIDWSAVRPEPPVAGVFRQYGSSP